MMKRQLPFLCLTALFIFLIIGNAPRISYSDIQKEYRVTAILPPESNLFWNGVWSGVKTTSKESSFSLSQYEFSDIENSNMEDAIKMLNIASRTQSDGILLCPKGKLEDDFYHCLTTLKQQGIKILILDTHISSEYYDVFIGMDNEQVGASVAKYLYKQGNTDYPVILLHSNLKPETTVQRISGFYSFMEQHNTPFQISELITTSDISSGIGDILALIDSYDSPLYLIGFTPGYTLNAAYAVSSSQQADKAHVIGLAETKEAFQYVSDGIIQALFVQDNYALGVKAVETMEQLLSNQPISENHSIDIDLVTIDNISDYLETAS